MEFLGYTVLELNAWIPKMVAIFLKPEISKRIHMNSKTVLFLGYLFVKLRGGEVKKS